MGTEVERIVLDFDASIVKLEAKLDKVIARNAIAKKKIEESWKTTAIGAGVNDLTKSIAGAANEVPILGAALEALGPAGIAAALGIGAVIAAMEAGKKAAEFGDEIWKAAAKAGVSTTILQEYRFAIGEVGGEAKDADAAIGGFTKTLGLAALGAPKALKAFQALKLDPKALVGDTDRALGLVLDKLSQINNEPERQALAQKMGLPEFIPLARLTTEQLRELREEGEKTGQVMSAALVENAHKSADEFENLGHAAKVALESGLMPLSGLAVAGTSALAKLAQGFQDIAGDIKDATRLLAPFADTFVRAIKDVMATAPGIQGILTLLHGLHLTLEAAASAGRVKTLKSMMADMNAGMSPADMKKKYGDDNLYGTTDAAGPPVGTVTPGDAFAKKAADTEKPSDYEAKTAALEKDIADAEKQFLQAHLAMTAGLDDRYEIEKAISEAEWASTQAELAKKQAALDADTTLEDNERIALQKQQDALETQAAHNKEIRDDALYFAHREDLRKQDLTAVEARIDLETDGLNVAKALARTAEERQAIELKLLDLADQKLQADQRAVIASDKSTPEERDLARARIAANQATAGDRRTAVTNANLGPLADYFNKLPQTTAEANEAMQSLAANGLQSVIDGLAGAATGSEKLGDVFKHVITQMIADLARLQLQRMAFQIFAAVTGNPAAAAGMPVADTVVPYASGTMSSAAGWALVGEKGPEYVRLPGNSQVIPNAALRNVGINGGGSSGAVTITFDNRGAVIWEQAAKQMMSYADRAAATASMGAIGAARSLTPDDLSRQASRRL